jgi:hypothetical protein
MFELNFKHIWIENPNKLWFYIAEHILNTKVHINKNVNCLSHLSYIKSQSLIDNKTLFHVTNETYETLYKQPMKHYFETNPYFIWNITLQHMKHGLRNMWNKAYT